jgi:hypothetical protein
MRVTIQNKLTGEMQAVNVQSKEIFIFKFNSAIAFNGPLFQYGLLKPSKFRIL